MHITYNDGSNPFVMINVSWDAVVKEIEFQMEKNGRTIKEILILP